MRAGLLAALMLLFAMPASAISAQNRWYVPDFFTAQTGGYAGYVAAGIGYEMSDIWETDILFGYVPESVGGEDIYQISWKNSLHPFRYKFGKRKMAEISLLYFGFTAIYGFDDDLFLILPERYPEDYYPPTALRLAVNIGAGGRYGVQGLFIEATALDSGVRAYAYNTGFISPEDVLTIAVGYRFYMGRTITLPDRPSEPIHKQPEMED